MLSLLIIMWFTKFGTKLFQSIGFISTHICIIASTVTRAILPTMLLNVFLSFATIWRMYQYHYCNLPVFSLNNVPIYDYIGKNSLRPILEIWRHNLSSAIHPPACRHNSFWAIMPTCRHNRLEAIMPTHVGIIVQRLLYRHASA